MDPINCGLIGKRVQAPCKADDGKTECGEIVHVTQCPQTGNTLVVVAFDDGHYSQVNIESCKGEEPGKAKAHGHAKAK